MTRIGLVGTGDAGRHHARALRALSAQAEQTAQATCTFAALCGRDPARLARFRQEQSVPETTASFGDLDGLLASGAVDAVILATPDGVHADQVVAAARAGVAVLVEKPFAPSAEDADRAELAAREAGVALEIGYHVRHHAAHALARVRLAELVGTLRTIDVRWAWPDPAVDGWRARGDGARFWSLAALGTHGIDLALWLSGSPAARDVAAVVEPRRSAGIDRAAEVVLGLAAGVRAHVSVSVDHRAVSRVRITGDLGEVEAIGTLGARGDGELWHRAPRSAAAPLPFDACDPYEAQLRAFLCSVAAGFRDDPARRENVAILDRVAAFVDHRGP